MKRFYIIDGSQTNEVFINVSPNLTETQDTTNDTFSCVLRANNQSEPYKPLTKFQVFEDNTWLYNFVIVSDSVSIFSVKPLTYRHTLSLVQDRRYLDKHLIRNSTFNQQKTTVKSLCSFFSMYPGYDYSSDPQHWFWNDRTEVYTENLIVSGTRNIKRVKITYRFFETDTTDAHNVSELTTLPSEFNDSKLQLIMTAPNGDTTITDDVFIGRKIGSFYSEDLKYFFNQHGNGTYTLEFNGEKVDSQYSQRPGKQIKFARLLGTTTNQKHYFAQVYFELEAWYSVYNVINDLLEQQKLEKIGETKTRLFELPTSGDLYDLLTTTRAPDRLNFTQCTMFQALEEIFKMFDATFKLTQNNVLDIEYFNERKGTINKNFTGKTKASREEYFNNGYVSYYQQARVNQQFPSNNNFAHLRSIDVGIPQDNSAYKFMTDKPIEIVNELYIRVANQNIECYATPFTYGPEGFTINELDLSYYVVEESIWSLLDKTNTMPSWCYQKQQNNTIPYTKGTRNINVVNYFKNQIQQEIFVLYRVVECAIGRFFGIKQRSYISSSLSNWSGVEFKDYMLRCDYLANIDGRLQIESITNKYNGSMLVNQANGLLELNKLGLNILGLSLKNGEPIMSANVELTNWNERIEKGQVYIENNETWVVNVVKYTIYNDKIMASLELVKNFNGLSTRVQIDREPRLYNISSELTSKSEDNYIEYVYFSSNPIEGTNDNLVIDNSKVNLMLYKTFNYTYRQDLSIDYTVLSTKDINEKVITSSKVHFPMVKYASANNLCFEMSYDSPISAGNQLTYTSGWFGDDKYFSSVVKYTDEEGWADVLTIDFCKSSGDFTNDFPIVSVPSANIYGSISNLKYYKRPNEILALNYQLCFLPLPNREYIDFIGNKFLTTNGLINKQEEHTFYIVYSTTDTYDILDTKGLNFANKVLITSSSGYSNLGVNFYYSGLPTANLKSWAIVDENNDIYFASNNTSRITSTEAHIYWKFKRTRI